jgi:hypothetical protein
MDPLFKKLLDNCPFEYFDSDAAQSTLNLSNCCLPLKNAVNNKIGFYGIVTLNSAKLVDLDSNNNYEFVVNVSKDTAKSVLRQVSNVWNANTYINSSTHEKWVCPIKGNAVKMILDLGQVPFCRRRPDGFMETLSEKELKYMLPHAIVYAEANMRYYTNQETGVKGVGLHMLSLVIIGKAVDPTHKPKKTYYIITCLVIILACGFITLLATFLNPPGPPYQQCGANSKETEEFRTVQNCPYEWAPSFCPLYKVPVCVCDSGYVKMNEICCPANSLPMISSESNGWPVSTCTCIQNYQMKNGVCVKQ